MCLAEDRDCILRQPNTESLPLLSLSPRDYDARCDIIMSEQFTHSRAPSSLRESSSPEMATDQKKGRLTEAKTCKACDQCRNRKVRCISALYSKPSCSGEQAEDNNFDSSGSPSTLEMHPLYCKMFIDHLSGYLYWSDGPNRGYRSRNATRPVISPRPNVS